MERSGCGLHLLVHIDRPERLARACEVGGLRNLDVLPSSDRRRFGRNGVMFVELLCLAAVTIVTFLGLCAVR